VEYRLERTSEGWCVIRADTEDASGEVVAGPFSRGEAIAWVQERGNETEALSQREGAAARAEAGSDVAIVAALKAAIDRPPAAPRGRPVPGHPRKADIAFEYYWQLRRGKSAPRAVATVAKAYGKSTDHVRKIRQEYAPVANYDDRLLTELRAQAFERRMRPAKATQPPKVSSTGLDGAKDWLIGLLRKLGPTPAQDVYRRAAVAGYSRRTIERAKAVLGIASPRGGKGSSWQLRNSAKRRI
jgi:hypothetical protein